MSITKIDNSVPVFELKEIVIGSQFRFAIRFRRKISSNPDVYEPLLFDGMEFEALIKDNVDKDLDADADAAFQVTARGDVDEDDQGWVDLYIDGDAVDGTGTIPKAKEYWASLKVWPTGEPEKGDTLAVLKLPFVFKATR